jgi:membrane-associated protease RseP (regulator of RpoE activity)
MLGIPEPTAYDVRFRLLRVPVRVHPLFWLATAVLGLGGGDEQLGPILIWVGCVFVSILVHEYGHALTARLFRCRPSIVLYGMGGLCTYEIERQLPWQRLAVLVAGPGAGLFFYACIRIGVIALGTPESSVAREILWDLFQINFFWSLVNLLPIWPLDGGQITGVVLTKLNRFKGLNWTHVISLITAALLAMLVFTYLKDMFLGFFFAIFALINYQILQAHHHTARYGALDDDADWWKR